METKPEMVSQSELSQEQNLRTQLNREYKEWLAAWESIRVKIEAGATVESGPLTAKHW